ncbi:MAG: hypothetical protein KAT32_01060 [Candidatus Moranbacteria bacterium]|nr:hypothetical protein [Candidatus Moranbacteria bacterium]
MLKFDINFDFKKRFLYNLFSITWSRWFLVCIFVIFFAYILNRELGMFLNSLFKYVIPFLFIVSPLYLHFLSKNRNVKYFFDENKFGIEFENKKLEGNKQSIDKMIFKPNYFYLYIRYSKNKKIIFIGTKDEIFSMKEGLSKTDYKKYFIN